MVTYTAVENEATSAWKAATSLDEIRALNEDYLRNINDTLDLSEDERLCVPKLLRLQSYGMICIGGVEPPNIQYLRVDGEWTHSRRVPVFTFLMPFETITKSFLAKIEEDKLLNKYIYDYKSTKRICASKPCLQYVKRSASTRDDLLEKNFSGDLTCPEELVKTLDLNLDSVPILRSASIYIFSVMFHIDPKVLQDKDDAGALKELERDVLQTIEKYAQQTLAILPPYTSVARSEIILDKLVWKISDSVLAARTESGESVDLTALVFPGAVNILLPIDNRASEAIKVETGTSWYSGQDERVTVGDVLDAIRALWNACPAEGVPLFKGLRKGDADTWRVIPGEREPVSKKTAGWGRTFIFALFGIAVLILW
ncbi:hypothetical protein PWT90_02024 [Aphanocladium album]|nr:hypothetical protein PWT90_02024 [Aphanocladium album]